MPYHLTRGAVCGTSGCFFSLPRYLRRCVTLNNTLIIVVYQSIRAHLPTKLSREPALRGSRAHATAAARPWAVAHGSQRGQGRSLATHGPPTDERSTRATGARQQSRRSSDRHGTPLRGGARISTRPGPFPRDAWAADGRSSTKGPVREVRVCYLRDASRAVDRRGLQPRRTRGERAISFTSFAGESAPRRSSTSSAPLPGLRRGRAVPGRWTLDSTRSVVDDGVSMRARHAPGSRCRSADA